MRQCKWLWPFVCVWILASPCRAQRTGSNPLGGSLSVQDAGTCSTSGSYLWQVLPANANQTTVNLSGTFSATLTVRLSNNGGGSWVTVGTLSAAGTTTYSTNGYTDICVDLTAYTSGSAGVTLTTGIFNGNGGSGGVPSQQVNGGTLYNPTSTGSFDNSAEHDYFLSLLTGGGPCDPATVSRLGGQLASRFLTNAITGIVCTPSSTTNAWSTGVLGMAEINDPGSTGFYGIGEGVGITGVGYCAVGTASCWGSNLLVGDKSGNTNNVLLGQETDITVNNASSTGYGAYIKMGGPTQPTTFHGYYLAAPGGTGTFTDGFQCATGSVLQTSLNANASGNCLDLEPSVTGTSKGSNAVTFWTTNSSGTKKYSQLVAQNDADNLIRMILTNFGEDGAFNDSYIGANLLALPHTFSAIPFTCDSTHEGMMSAVTDSTTITWGATITGGGTNHVLAYCDGTNWTVAAK